MVTLEQVEKLREYADISYDEAKAALENAGGDILQAIVDLERLGKINPPQGGGQYSSGSIEAIAIPQQDESKKGKSQEKSHSSEQSAFHKNMKSFGRWLADLFHKGNVNALIVERNGVSVMKLPLTVAILLLIIVPWFVIAVLILGLFFSLRYSIQGPDIHGTKVNDAMNSVANAAEEIKNDLRN